MNTVVVQAHPLSSSYSAALADHVVEGLRAADIVPAVFRLGEGDRPDLESLGAAERLILVHPTWWGGQPAMVLGWLHEVMGDERRPLAAVRELITVTSCGSSQLLNRIQGEWGRRYIEQRVAAVCAPDVVVEWLPLYKIDRQPQHVITAHLRTVQERFATR